MRFKLNAAAERNEPPTLTVINRSSNRVPEGWKAGTDYYRTSLPIVERLFWRNSQPNQATEMGSRF